MNYLTYLLTPSKEEGGFTEKQMADNIFITLSADRKVYAKDIITRLVNKEKVIKFYKKLTLYKMKTYTKF